VAVDGVSLRVPGGTVFGLLGPNGAGKTTTIRMIMNIMAPDSGEVLLFERPRTEADSHRSATSRRSAGSIGRCP